jgi:glutamine amidotransferase
VTTLNTPSIAIFDYGAGNLFSLKAALQRNGARRVSIVKDFKAIKNFGGLVLPGVGNFDPALKSIEPQKDLLIKAIENAADGRGAPILGICLGMELLFDKSEEGVLDGLKALAGRVVMLTGTRIKVPHMGWNNLQSIKKSSRLLHGVKDGSWVYFVHSYRTMPKESSIVAANFRYGAKIPAVVERGSLFGTQFHPEKSGFIGAILIRNFLKACY